MNTLRLRARTAPAIAAGCAPLASCSTWEAGMGRLKKQKQLGSGTSHDLWAFGPWMQMMSCQR